MGVVPIDTGEGRPHRQLRAQHLHPRSASAADAYPKCSRDSKQEVAVFAEEHVLGEGRVGGRMQRAWFLATTSGQRRER